MPELDAVAQQVVALGLNASLVERIADRLLLRYQGDDAFAAYFPTIDVVEAEALVNLAGKAPAPAAYLAFHRMEERLEASRRSVVLTRWLLLLILPMPSQLTGPGTLVRHRLIERAKSLTIGGVPGIVENELDPGNPLAYRLDSWASVDASTIEPGNSALRSLIPFALESNIDVYTREVG